MPAEENQMIFHKYGNLRSPTTIRTKGLSYHPAVQCMPGLVQIGAPKLTPGFLWGQDMTSKRKWSRIAALSPS